MNKKSKKELGILVLLAIVVGIMTIGFSQYNSTLNIDGNVTVSAAKFSVHYDTATEGQYAYAETTNSVAANPKSVTNTDYSFTVTLTKPGDFYEGTIYVVNDGTFDAQLKSITMSTLGEAQKKYLTYTVNYNGTSYTETTSDLSVDLAAGNRVPVKVRVEYVAPASASDLPAEAQNITVSGSLYYESK